MSFSSARVRKGKYILHCAREYAARRRTSAYAEVIELFVREEQRHARDLGRFMDVAGIPRRSRTWPDTVFRRLRQLGGLEISISVLITAEIIAKVYYAALREATGIARPATDLRSGLTGRTRACPLPLRLPGAVPRNAPAGALRPDRGRPALSLLRHLFGCLEIPQQGDTERRNEIQQVLDGLLAGDECGDDPCSGRPEVRSRQVRPGFRRLIDSEQLGSEQRAQRADAD